MSDNLDHFSHSVNPPISSEQLANQIASTDFSQSSATIIGYGLMGKEYLKSLQALKVGHIRVYTRNPLQLNRSDSLQNTEFIHGDLNALETDPSGTELGIIAIPIPVLSHMAIKLCDLGFNRLLIEKPVALSSDKIQKLSDTLDSRNVTAWAGYNRLSYPAFHELNYLVYREGGVTSCSYSITELVNNNWQSRFNREELERWGISNTLHVISMAHGIIGLPQHWTSYKAGGLDWHSSGSIFVGSGASINSTPFSYHGDWGSKGRWEIKVYTKLASYKLCPLEELQHRQNALKDWKYKPIATYDSSIKPGVLEQTASALRSDSIIGNTLLSIKDTKLLTAFAENIFGYL